MINGRCIAFLYESGAHHLPHGSRTLFDHLIGTHDLLLSWGNDLSVCKAGLFHSIYGTYIYRHHTIKLTRRRNVRSVIGREAENLAYLFCSLKRPRALLAAVEHTGTPCPALQNRITLSRLLEIECANLIEQHSHSRTLIHLRQISDRVPGLLSVAALDSMERYLNAQAALAHGCRSAA